ncbi:MAG: hypothetical protein ACLR6J_05660 [Parabacteroides merdae]
MKNYQRLKGLIAASFTPMDAQGKINLSVIDKYADLMAKSDMTGVFVLAVRPESRNP